LAIIALFEYFEQTIRIFTLSVRLKNDMFVIKYILFIIVLNYKDLKYKDLNMKYK